MRDKNSTTTSKLPISVQRIFGDVLVENSNIDSISIQVDKEIKINKYNSEKVQDLINIVVESVDENLFLDIDYSDLKEIFAKDSAISYSIEEFEKEVSIDEIAKTLTEETYTTVGEEVKKKALVFYEMFRNVIENELIFINEVNMKINEILGDTYDMMFSYNATDDDNEKIKICLISK